MASSMATYPTRSLHGVGRASARDVIAGQGDPHPAVPPNDQALLRAAVDGELLGVLETRSVQLVHTLRRQNCGAVIRIAVEHIRKSTKARKAITIEAPRQLARQPLRDQHQQLRPVRPDCRGLRHAGRLLDDTTEAAL